VDVQDRLQVEEINLPSNFRGAQDETAAAGVRSALGSLRLQRPSREEIMSRIGIAACALAAALASPAAAQGVVSQKNISLAMAQSIAQGALTSALRLASRLR
jgi:hypothetical protein